MQQLVNFAHHLICYLCRSVRLSRAQRRFHPRTVAVHAFKNTGSKNHVRYQVIGIGFKE
jgi:hypothetical protein